jgi:hypothetical protein
MAHLRPSLLWPLLAMLFALGARADGTGLIGYGKVMYKPTCCSACRNVVRKAELACTDADSAENHGTSHNPVLTSPDCFVRDPAFLKTMSLCIDTYCPLSDLPPMSLIEEYWASHLGTGTIGDYQYVPTMSYSEALSAAREDESQVGHDHNSTSTTADEHDHHGEHKRAPVNMRRHSAHLEAIPERPDMEAFDVSSPLPTFQNPTDALSATTFVHPVDWQLQYNYLSDFETNEVGHSTMT